MDARPGILHVCHLSNRAETPRIRTREWNASRLRSEFRALLAKRVAKIGSTARRQRHAVEDHALHTWKFYPKEKNIGICKAKSTK